MNTPVIDFVKNYIGSQTVRMHMPGHKGKAILGCEIADITEISGAGELYSAEGSIAEAEKNTASLFGTAKTCWVTEGSSQCIRAMVALALQHSESKCILAARNVHRSFLTACALLDAQVTWLTPENADFNLCSCPITTQQVEKALSCMEKIPAAVWLTSPDYLGFVQDVAGIASVCKRYGVPLLVDNAHGAYLKFLEESQHPMDLGAAMCCDSAHKTLPALTGCAYLHISADAPYFAQEAKRALALFGSTSPSWLLLQSLDAVNSLLEKEYPQKLKAVLCAINEMKRRLSQLGWKFFGNEPLKITVDACSCGYHGADLARTLRSFGIECEYADPDYVVLMPSPWTSQAEVDALENALSKIAVQSPLLHPQFHLPRSTQAMSIRRSCLALSETIPVERAVGRVLASGAMSCPPAVSVVTAGEVISAEAVEIMKYYGTTEVAVVKE